MHTVHIDDTKPYGVSAETYLIVGHFGCGKPLAYLVSREDALAAKPRAWVKNKGVAARRFPTLKAAWLTADDLCDAGFTVSVVKAPA